ncbi:MAG: hypothetical protein ACYST6_19950, partial [Planctomycetota bacterium]
MKEGRRVLESAKKAIEAVRDDVSRENGGAVCSVCKNNHRPEEPCAGVPEKGTSQQLTRRAIDSICRILSGRQPAGACAKCGTEHDASEDCPVGEGAKPVEPG